MATTQMNMRIDSALKTTGDLAIREGGSTPSEIVRAVWEFVARNRHEPLAVQRLLEYLRDEQQAENDSSNRVDEIEEQVLRGSHLIEEYCRERGIDTAALAPTSYEDLKAAAYDEGFFGEAMS